MRILMALLGVAILACGGHRASQIPEPDTPNAALGQFLSAIKDHNRQRVAELWGTKKGSVHSRGQLPPAYEDSLIQVFEVYLQHDGYRIIDGPVPVIGVPDVVSYHVELQLPNCNRVQPLDLVHTNQGGWLVANVHLEVAAQGIPRCQRQGGNPN